jgi:hypothetical protein
MSQFRRELPGEQKFYKETKRWEKRQNIVPRWRYMLRIHSDQQLLSLLSNLSRHFSEQREGEVVEK